VAAESGEACKGTREIGIGRAASRGRTERSAEMLEKVPEGAKGKVCVCRKCGEAVNGREFDLPAI